MVQSLHLFHCYRVSAPVLALPHTIFSNFLIQRKSLTPWHSACARRWWLWLVPSIHIQWYRSPITLLAGLSNQDNIQLLLARTLDFKYQRAASWFPLHIWRHNAHLYVLACLMFVQQTMLRASASGGLGAGTLDSIIRAANWFPNWLAGAGWSAAIGCFSITAVLGRGTQYTVDTAEQC